MPFAALDFDAVAAEPVEGSADRVRAIGALLAAAEAVGAAGRMLDDARAYAAERRQFGRTIGSFQSLRHILADMHVAHASAWSTVLYAAASLDGGDAARTTSIAKAYVSRSCREVAHGAMQVFGGIAFTEEHPAHRYLRRIIVREQQFGDALHHERELGRALRADRSLHDCAVRESLRRVTTAGSTIRPRSGSRRSPPAPSPSWSGRCSRRRSTIRAGRRATWR